MTNVQRKHSITRHQPILYAEGQAVQGTFALARAAVLVVLAVAVSAFQ
jgi:hypothetical protein